MSNLFGIQQMNRQGLLANQKALSVIGNNIANAATPGYSRQQVIFGDVKGGGVTVLGVKRIRDEFLDVKLRDSNARLGGHQVAAQNLSLLETALNESDTSGITPAIQAFFSSLQDLTLQPGGTPERETLRSNATLLSSAIEGAVNQVKQNREQVDQQIRGEIDKINLALDSLAEVNKQLSTLAADADRNTLEDQRDALLEQISGDLPIHVLKDERGVVTVFGQGGIAFVEGQNAYHLAAQPDPSNSGFVQVGVSTISGSLIPLGGKLTEGTLGGLLRVRDQDSLDLLNRMQRMTAEFVRSFNAQHRLGSGLDGVAGRDFFTGLATTSSAAYGNTGGASISSNAIVDESLLTFDDYEIRFTSATAYDIVDTTTGAALSTGNAYVSGNPIVFAGQSVTISSTPAVPAVGDVFKVNSYAGTSERFDLSAAVKASTDAIAAGFTAAPGDNQNALALASLRNAKLLSSGTLSFEEYYSNARVQLGVAVNAENSKLLDEETSQSQIQQLADSARAVSIDEEAVNMIQFQRAFEASSRMISVTDELLQSLLDITR